MHRKKVLESLDVLILCLPKPFSDDSDLITQTCHMEIGRISQVFIHAMDWEGIAKLFLTRPCGHGRGLLTQWHACGTIDWRIGILHSLLVILLQYVIPLNILEQESTFHPPQATVQRNIAFIYVSCRMLLVGCHDHDWIDTVAGWLGMKKKKCKCNKRKPYERLLQERNLCEQMAWYMEWH